MSKMIYPMDTLSDTQNASHSLMTIGGFCIAAMIAFVILNFMMDSMGRGRKGEPTNGVSGVKTVLALVSLSGALSLVVFHSQVEKWIDAHVHVNPVLVIGILVPFMLLSFVILISSAIRAILA